jgi:hypothetical protein
VWFLTSLYHDIGYVFEYDSKSHLNKNIKDFLPETANIKTCKNLKYYKLGKNYFKYRKTQGIIDHGVVGGFRLYSILRNIYENVLKTKRDQLHVFKGLSYSPELYKFHKIAADAIIRHNMWLAIPDNIYDYKKYDLYDLIESVGKDNKIDITNEQFTFLLGLCDTIEPIKRFSDIDAAFVLKHIKALCQMLGWG